NYYPAIVEAAYARVPLVVLTADRPHELRGIGAPQTIDQMNMYANYVKDFWEMALPEGREDMLRYVRIRAGRAVRIANEGSKGPVHVNFPFREPLMPNVSLEGLWGENKASFNPTFEGKKMLDDKSIRTLADKLSHY